MNIFFYPYQLKSSIGAGVQRGALIKVEEQGVWGVADICPKPNLGDLQLAEEIKNKGPLFSRALELACEDLKARRDGYSLLLDLPIENNFLLLDEMSLDNLVNELYGTVKIKGKIEDDPNFLKLLEILNLVCTLWEDVKIRLDFNNKLHESEFNYFLNHLTSQMRKQIEYIEDPCVMSASWKLWNKIVPLAADFQKPGVDSMSASYKIVKPARERPVLDTGANITFTSAMDHPIGVAHALRVAQSILQNKANKGVHGFLTLDVYETSEFNAGFVVEGRTINFSPQNLKQFGIGFTEELSCLAWQVEKDLRLA